MLGQNTISERHKQTKPQNWLWS